MPIDVKKYIDVDSQDTPIVIYRDKVPVMETLNVTPAITSQEINPAEGIDGFSRVNVSAVNATIDSNILPQNIKEGVNILGVDGSLKTTKFGATLDAFLGNTTSGILYEPSDNVNLVFDGVEYLSEYALYYRFYRQANILSVSFPDLLQANSYNSLQYCFSYCLNLTSVSCPKATYIRMPNTFSGCSNLETLYFPMLETLNSSPSAFARTKATNITIPKVKTIAGCNNCFQGSGITAVDLPSVESITQSTYLFSSCPNLVSANLSGLKSIVGSSGAYGLFYQDGNLETVDMSNLEEVSATNGLAYAWYGCSKLKMMIFDKLKKIGTNVGGYTFYEFQWAFANSGIETLSFPALKSDSFVDYEVFTNMLYGVDGCTVHFPSNMESVIGQWADVLNGFGGTNTTVLFDLPATE